MGSSNHPVHLARGPTLEFGKRPSITLKNEYRAYQNLAMELIFLYRFLLQTHEQGLNSSIRLRKVLIAADDALKSAAKAGNRTSMQVDEKFREAIDLLSGFEKDFPSMDPTSDPNIGRSVTRENLEGKMSDSDKSDSPSTILYALKKYLHAKPMGNEWPKLTRVVKFHLLRTPPDAHPIVVTQMLSDSSSLQEILWNFCRFKDQKERLTLRDNPHFYVELPTSPEAYGDSVQIDPTVDFRSANKFYVLIDKPKHAYIMTDRESQPFGNFWCPNDAIVFKDVCGRLRGEGVVKASLRGTHCGFCERIQVSTVPVVSRNRHELQPIITEGCPWTGWKCSIGCLLVHGSDDIGLEVCTGRATPDTRADGLLLVPLPPTSEQPGYSVAYRTHIHMLDNKSLLQIFSQYRLNHKENWDVRHRWRKLAHVCRRWRHLIYDPWSHLDLSLILTNDSPSLDTLSHLPPIPLIIDYSDKTRALERKDEDNIHLGLQQHGRIRQIVLRAPSSSLRIWLELMNRPFPRLADLLLLSTTIDEINLMLPKTFQAPDLRRLALHGIGFSAGLSFLSSFIALSTLSLTHIGASCYFSPGHLVTQLEGLPRLEELSIGFAIPISLPSGEGEPLLAPIPPVTLPTLRQLTFRGVDIYLENLVAQINTPLLKRLSLTFFFDLAFTLVNLTEFIHRTEGFGCLIAQVIFNKDGVSIYAGYYEQQSVGKLSLHVNCERLDWQIDSVTQVCIALGNVLSAVEVLTLDLNVDGMPSNWENALDSVMWHELLLPFTRVKKLHIGSSLTVELSQALESAVGGLALGLLPELQELGLDNRRAKKAFFAFVEFRKSVGRPIRLLVKGRQGRTRGSRNA